MTLRFWLSVCVLFVATCLSTLALHHARRWHPDEAFYMTMARNAAVKGDWMLVSEPLDKPPLTYYTNAVSLVLFAVDSDENAVLFLNVYKSEFAGRIPSLLMSVVLVAVIIAMTKSAGYRDWRTACLAGLFAALSPLRIVFAPTAFTDMPMLLFAALALWMAARSKWGRAGFCFILSLAAKPQSLFYLPLFIGILVCDVRPHPKPLPEFREGLIRFATPVMVGLIMLWAWDSARVNLGATSFWALGQAYYPPTMLTPLADYVARMRALWSTVQYLFGHGILTGILLIWSAVNTLRLRKRFNVLLMLWLLGFFGLHIVLTLNVLDRNLLLLVPVACVLVAQPIRTGYRPSQNKADRRRGVPMCAPVPHNDGRLFGFSIRTGCIPSLQFLGILVVQFVILACAVFAIIAATGAYDVGGDDGQHDGIDELADYLNKKPIATVIYDRWLDWELDYYMGEWTNKRRVYYPTPQSLVNGALELEESGVRYFVAPTQQNITDWLEALSAAGITLSLDYESPNFRVYALHRP